MGAHGSVLVDVFLSEGGFFAREEAQGGGEEAVIVVVVIVIVVVVVVVAAGRFLGVPDCAAEVVVVAGVRKGTLVWLASFFSCVLALAFNEDGKTGVKGFVGDGLVSAATGISRSPTAAAAAVFLASTHVPSRIVIIVAAATAAVFRGILCGV